MSKSKGESAWATNTNAQSVGMYTTLKQEILITTFQLAQPSKACQRIGSARFVGQARTHSRR